MRRLLAFVAGIACAVGVARADDLADCDGAAFRSAINADAAFKCVEIERQSYSANGQSFTIRALREAGYEPVVRRWIERQPGAAHHGDE